MLSDIGEKNLQLLKELIPQFWGQDAQAVDVSIIDAPFDMFEIKTVIYGHFEILIAYDRSIVGISVWLNGSFINLRKLTSQKTVIGFSSSEKESILHNFKVLDNTLKSMQPDC